MSGRPVTLITGASAGIGWALAEVFAQHGHELVLAARRTPELERLADKLAAAGAPRPTVLSLDLVQPKVGDRIAAELDRAEQLAMIDLNVRTLTDLSLAFIPSLAEQRGGILNVASVAGFLSGPNMTVYYATKAFVVSFSEALNYELKSRDIRVTALCPGPVPTEFQARAGIVRRPSIMDRSAEE